jgi:L-lactate dehydrogenase complex protein LldE
MDVITSCCRAVSPAVSCQIPGDREYSEIAKLPLEWPDRSPVPSPNQSFAHKFPYFIDQGNWPHRAGNYFGGTGNGFGDLWSDHGNTRETSMRVALFVTCLVDLFRPTVGFAAIKLLEEAGCTVEVPRSQTCCGQPAYNSGDRADAKAIAEQVLNAFEGYDHVVVPSGSCAGMIRRHYPELFADDPAVLSRAERLAPRIWELVSFLVDICGMYAVTARWDHRVTYHDACSGLRELGVKDQPRRLLASVGGLSLKEMPGAETCCGFGGTFCVKYPDISDKMVSDKAAEIVGTGAEAVLAGDLGCLLNMAGKLHRGGRRIEVRHVAEVLAGLTEEVPPIGVPR